MIAAAEIEERIVAALPGATVAVHDLTGGSDHFRAEIVAEQFNGKTAIARHRMVYDSLSDVMGGALHALSLDTRTPEEAK